MNAILRLVGIDYTYFEATDGQNLTLADVSASFGVNAAFLPGYQDPYHKRGMKSGELGWHILFSFSFVFKFLV